MDVTQIGESMPKIAAAQMVSTASVADNLKLVKQFFTQAKEEAVDLLVLPENFAFMGMKERDKLQIAEQSQSGEIQARIAQLAKQYDLWVIAGTLPLKGSDNRVKASSLVFDNKGSWVACYDKIHLFDVQVAPEEVHRESATVERGHELVLGAT